MKETPFIVAFIGLCCVFATPASILLFVWTTDPLYIQLLVTAVIGFVSCKWVDEFIKD